MEQVQSFKYVKAVALQEIVPENTYDAQQWGVNQIGANSKSLYAHLRDGTLRVSLQSTHTHTLSLSHHSPFFG